MQTKTFKLPKHPRRGDQQIVIERENSKCVWLLIIDETKAKPLPSLTNPKNPKQVLDALRDVSGDTAVADYILGGYSKP